MTTIAWDGHTLAADTQCNANGYRFYGVKVWRLSNGWLYGGSGCYEDVLAVREWLELGGNKPDVGNNFTAILVRDGRAYRLEEKLIEIPMLGRTAAGSGRDYALAAMHCGESAASAVAVAGEYDPSTGGEIQMVQAGPQPVICPAPLAAA